MIVQRRIGDACRRVNSLLQSIAFDCNASAFEGDNYDQFEIKQQENLLNEVKPRD